MERRGDFDFDMDSEPLAAGGSDGKRTHGPLFHSRHVMSSLLLPASLSLVVSLPLQLHP